MSPGMVKFLLWSAAILLVCYMFSISPIGVVTDVTHAVKSVHDSSQTTGGRP